MSRSRRFPPILAVLAVLLGLAPAASAGDGTFTTAPDLPVSEPSALAAGDFNNDGRPDLAVASEDRRRVELFVQRAEGGLAPAPPVVLARRPELIAVADFNRDGNDDLAVSDAEDQDLKVGLGDGKGSFKDAPDVELKQTAQSVVTGDFDNDGIDDIAVAGKSANAQPHRVFAALGDGSGKFKLTATGEGAAVLAVADFNSDAKEDIAFGGVPGFGNGNLTLGSGTGAFAGRSDIPLPQPASARRGWAVADFDRDSKTDVVAALKSDATAVRLGDGNGKFPRGTDVPTRGTPTAIAVGDFNSDGNEDFVVTDTSGAAVARVRLGDGKGGFTDAADVPTGARPVDIAIADFDSDGNDDLAIADAATSSVKLRLGAGRAPLEGNLVADGGFEGRTPAGWQAQGGAAYARYGAPSHAFFPSRIASPRYGTGGDRMLVGGSSAATNGVTSMSQTADVSNDAAAIDDRRATANLSAYLGGALNIDDTMAARAEFVNGAGATIGSFQIGPVTAADRGNVTTLLKRDGARAVPPGTRRIRVSLISSDADKAMSSATADNVKLTLATTPAQPGPGAQPKAQPDAFGRNTLVTLKPLTRRLKPGKPLKVRVRNRNAFRVTGRLQGGRRTRLSVGARAVKTVKVRLTRKQRRRLQRRRALSVRLTAVIRDPAGQTRRVGRRVRVRLRRK